MAVLQTIKTIIALGFAAVLALAFVLASPAAAQFEDLEEQCPEEFPLCPEGEEGGEDDGLGEDDGFEDDGFGEDDGFDDDPQVSETPEGGVAAGTGASGSGGPLPLLLAGALGVVALGGLAVRRRFAPQA